MSPQRWHEKKHGGWPFEQCWQCQHDRAVCRSKLRFPTREAVDAAVVAKNEGEGYTRPVVRYPCRWCGAYHMNTAVRKHERRRAEKQRRKWLSRTVRA